MKQISLCLCSLDTAAAELCSGEDSAGYLQKAEALTAADSHASALWITYTTICGAFMILSQTTRVPCITMSQFSVTR